MISGAWDAHPILSSSYCTGSAGCVESGPYDVPALGWGTSSCTSSMAFGIAGHVVEYSHNGVVVNRYEDFHTSGALYQLDSYQPYPISLLSSWPLDARDDIYDQPNYLTSALGGKGLQIGLTPHKPGEFAATDVHGNVKTQTFYSHVGTSNETSFEIPMATSSFTNAWANAHTASAGELVYSTKPTIFFWKNSTNHYSSSFRIHGKTGRQIGQLTSTGTEKFEITDGQGNRVAFHLRQDSALFDGTTFEVSGSTFVIVGTDGLTHNSTDLYPFMVRLAAVINRVTLGSRPGHDKNNLTLNVTASASTDAATSGAERVQIEQKTLGVGQQLKIRHQDMGVGFQFSTGPGNTAATVYNSNVFAPYEFGTYQSATDARSKTNVKSLYYDSVHGYKNPKASLQYNRHTFPYNTPFYATNRIRGRNPFEDSYEVYAQNMKHIGRDYSIVPEYRYSDHKDYYNTNYVFAKQQKALIFQDSFHPTLGYAKMTRKPFGPTVAENTTDFLIDKHKSNFLKLDGADVTSSAETKVPSDSTNRYKYDDIDGTKLTSNAAFSEQTYRSDPISVLFDGKYAVSDPTINYSFLLESDPDMTPFKITFNFSAFKRLLPYHGFYPATRTTQIGNAFKKEMTNGVDYNGIMANVPDGQGSQDQSYLQALLEPFMAPGILYNSIKSGIAVDYPIYTSVSASAVSPIRYYFPKEFVSSSYVQSYLNNSASLYGLQPQALSSSYHGGLSMMGSSRCIPTILTSLPNQRLPFKALYDPAVLGNLFDSVDATTGIRPHIYLVSDFVDLDRFSAYGQGQQNQNVGPWDTAYPLAGSRLSGTLSIGSPGVRPPKSNSVLNNSYYSMINNFLSETMDFFLDGAFEGKSKLPIALSDLKDTITPKDNKEFLMEVSLRSGKHQVMSEGPRRAGIGTSSSGFESLDDGEGYFLRNSSMRGYIYGPPIEIVGHNMYGVADTWTPGKERVGLPDNYPDSSMIKAEIGADDFASYFAANLQDPAYHAFTPPYFYGKSSLVYKLSGGGEELNLKQIVNLIKETGENSSYYIDEYAQPTSGSNSINNHIIGEDSLSLLTPSTASVSRGSSARMKIKASIPNLFPEPIQIEEIFADKEKETRFIWHVAPEWVCPVLDFSSSFSTVTEKQITVIPGAAKKIKYSKTTIENPYHDVTTGRGLWGGYGIDPYDEDHIIKSLTAQELTKQDDYMPVVGKGLYMEINDFSLEPEKTSPAFQFIEKNDAKSFHEFLEISPGEKTGSLAGLLGFQSENQISRYEIGKIANSKQVHEAIIMIPYLEEPIFCPLPEHVLYSNGMNHVDGTLLHDNNVVCQTREIIPGKHFLPINEEIFTTILNHHLIEATDRLNDNMHGASGVFGLTTDEALQLRNETLRETDIGKMITQLSSFNIAHRGFQLPIEFDFMHNLSIPPFQMIVMPFSHTLHKQELIDIYQGVMPDSALRTEEMKRQTHVNPSFTPSGWAENTSTSGDYANQMRIYLLKLQLNFIKSCALWYLR